VRNQSKAIWMSLLALLLLWPVSVASAQNLDCLYAQADRDVLLAQALDGIGGEEPPSDFGHGSPRGAVPEQRRKHLEQFRTLKLLELLDLDEEQEVAFITSYRSVRKARQALDSKREELLDELATGLREESVSEDRIKQIAHKLRNADEEKLELQTSFLGKMEKVLRPEQYGKLLVFQGRFEMELLKATRGMGRNKMGRGQRP
jgi:Spy/CpxP family protein refolding chaperone